MANICSVDHKVYLSNDNQNETGREQLKSLLALMVNCDRNNNSPSYEKNLLRDMLVNLYGEDVAKTQSCRSFIESFEDDMEHGIITITESTAWSPCASAWDCVLKKFPNLSHAWVAQEPACQLYEKIDDDGMFPDRTYVVFSDVNEEMEFGVEFATLDEWRTALECACGGEPFDDGLSIEGLIVKAREILIAQGFCFTVYGYDEGGEITDFDEFSQR